MANSTVHAPRHRRSALRLFGSYRCAVLPGLHGGVGHLGKSPLPTRPPWLGIVWQETITFPEPAQEKSLLGFFLGLQKRFALLHAANPPSMAQYFLARKKNRSLSLSKGTLQKKTLVKNGVLRGFAPKPCPKKGGGLEGENLRASDSELVFPLQEQGSKGPPLKNRLLNSSLCLIIKCTEQESPEPLRFVLIPMPFAMEQGFLGAEPLNRAGKRWGSRGGKTLASE